MPSALSSARIADAWSECPARRYGGCLLAVCLAMLPGCRSATQTDLVEREMRHQEDEIYALQDYLAEYQQLLREYRSENEALKRGLVSGQFREGQPSGRPDRDVPPEWPAIPTPPPDNAPADEFNQPPSGIPALDFDESDIPPPDQTTSDEADIESDTVEDDRIDDEPTMLATIAHEQWGDDFRPQADASLDTTGGEVRPVAFEEFEEFEELAAPYTEQYEVDQVAQVLLRGKVWPGDATTGPRVLVDVDPFTATAEPIAFQGGLSLMFLASDSSGTPHELARWDFTSDELQPLAVDGTDDTAFQFPLQLPAEISADRQVELWGRLISAGGDKVLAQAAVDLGRPGHFASDMPTAMVVTNRVATRTAAVDDAGGALTSAVAVNESRNVSRPRSPLRQSDWRTARPGQPPKREPHQPHLEFNQSAWRTATQPIVVASPIVDDRPIYPPLPPRRTIPTQIAPTQRPDPPSVPQWSPDRPPDAADPSEDKPSSGPPAVPAVSPPVWSPNR